MKHDISKDLLLASLSNYYSNKNNINILKIIIENHEEKSKLSLRLIDWYVTNYCKKHNIVFNFKKSEYFNVYLNYRSQLKAFKKVKFDPFRRRDRITFYYNEKECINTTIGQLNFFRWAIDNKVLSNLENNILNVESDMLFSQKNSKNESKTTIKIVKQISSSIKNMTRYNGNTLLLFS
jgi:hypothetical protein